MLRGRRGPRAGTRAHHQHPWSLRQPLPRALAPPRARPNPECAPLALAAKRSRAPLTYEAPCAAPPAAARPLPRRVHPRPPWAPAPAATPPPRRPRAREPQPRNPTEFTHRMLGTCAPQPGRAARPAGTLTVFFEVLGGHGAAGVGVRGPPRRCVPCAPVVDLLSAEPQQNGEKRSR